MDKRLLLIVILALAVRFAIFPFVVKDEQRMFTIGDAYEYDAIARNITENHSFYRSEWVSYGFPLSMRSDIFFKEPFDAFRPPVYPLFLAGVYSIFGHKPYAAIIIQILLGCLACVFVYKIGEVFIQKGVGFIAGLLMALDFPTAIYTNLLITETLFVLLCLLSVYFILKFFKEGKRAYLIYSGIFLGLSTLCRPIIQYFIILMVPLFFVVYRKEIKKGLLSCLLYILVFLVVITPWALRNYTTYGSFKLTAMSGWNLLVYNAAYLESYRQGGYDNLENVRENMKTEMDRAFIDRDIVSPFEMTQLYQEKALEKIFAYPGSYAKIHLVGIAKIFATPTFPISERIFGVPLDERTTHAIGKGLVTENFAKALGNLFRFFIQNWKALLYLPPLLLYLLFLYSMTGYGFYQIIKKRDSLLIFSLCLLIVVYSVLLGGAVGVARFRIPLMPYINLIAGYGLFQLILLRRKRSSLLRAQKKILLSNEP
jgi:4-amino-4-deoxy-L-arabinose transferase-like glycosyltransferase